ncbi:hypothetical protein Nepgr_032416 [Nepenthes gracilis]|uniref:Legume lectin domain-containing protein n=1 Tax=Nepenthes gracilis TaxID=150966 RepID=A0AAD3TIJ8_NEPGR|nr:hypothetical protein Nepgr_032416 [Nepenthes gracilis]
MTSFPPLQRKRYFLHFFLLILHFLTLAADPISLFALNVNDSDFDSKFALLGDAQIVKTEGSFINLTAGLVSGNGCIVYKNPIKFLEGKSHKPVSFSTDFTFSMSRGRGDGLAFVIVPTGELSQVFDGEGSFGISKNFKRIDGKFIAIEYDTHKDENLGDVNDNHIGIDVGSFISAEIIDVSSIDLVLNGGETLHSWIDYEANSRRLEIRLSKFGHKRPHDPLISYPIDLSKFWGEREVFVGISSGVNSTQLSSIYSWSFRVRTTANWLHSQPVDPQIHVGKDQVVWRKKNYALAILGRLIFATGCGTLIAFFMLLFWAIFFTSHSAATAEFPMKTVNIRYEKIDVRVDKISDDSAT